jgi:hypothetical protein
METPAPIYVGSSRARLMFFTTWVPATESFDERDVPRHLYHTATFQRPSIWLKASNESFEVSFEGFRVQIFYGRNLHREKTVKFKLNNPSTGRISGTVSRPMM